MLLPILALVVGFALLAWSADRFVDGSVGISRSLGVRPIVIGLVVMGFGTSAPEMLVSAMAAAGGEPEVALGNAIGSNTSNLTLILGVAALIRPLRVQSGVLRRELPMLLAVSLVAWGALADGHLGRGEGIGLFALLVVSMALLLRLAARSPDDELLREVVTELPAVTLTGRGAWLAALGGLALLVASSRLLVWGAVEIALGLGVDKLVISLTIVAIGTSLPELAASSVAALKNEADLAVGNVVGSNLFNTLAVLGIASVVAPFDIPAIALRRDVPLMLAATGLLLVLTLTGRRGILGRIEGGLLLLLFTAYQVLLFATQ